MAELVSQMTKEELRLMIDEALEQKLIELFGDPDEDLDLSDNIKKRLLQQRMAAKKGERGDLFATVVRELGL
ncbi:MAG: hypothetical protein C4586_02925 [Anaerolineaceae bacterium]|nr:MAG: hypothetical protein C4586_02925 [Anaerolineaceae bacterium]